MNRTILLAGATSAAGLAVARALIEAGATVIATGRSAERLAPLADAGARVEVADATSLTDMTALAERVGAVDGVVPLVGGWRGGGGLAGQSDEDFDGHFETLLTFRRNQVETVQTDTDGDGFHDMTSFYESGVLRKVTHRSPKTGQPVRAKAR